MRHGLALIPISCNFKLSLGVLFDATGIAEQTVTLVINSDG